MDDLGKDISNFEKDAPALVFAGHRAKLVVEDNGGNVVAVYYRLQPSITTIANAVGQLYFALSLLIDGVIVSASGESTWVPATFTTPLGASQVEAKAKIRVADGEAPGFKRTMYIPSPAISIFLATSGDGANQVDVENPDLVAFIALFEKDGQAYIAESHVAAPGGISSGVRVTRKSKRG